MHAPRSAYFDAVYRILRYLKGNPRKGILFKRHDHLNVEVHTDADWAVKSNMRFLDVVQKQNLEQAHGICEVRRLLEELRFTQTMPMGIYCDNKVVISIAHYPINAQVLNLHKWPSKRQNTSIKKPKTRRSTLPFSIPSCKDKVHVPLLQIADESLLFGYDGKPLINIEERKTAEMASRLSCKTEKLPIMYLGLPLRSDQKVPHFGNSS
ncbi:putative mitochondrial protein [Cucumis melo var. makuwa]|uniref:Mitochondrial protein n=1 Tax=Cucumis melo var. makuwa TaxID=1194695 RepID=A0A5D3C5E2_CUCMM|nr:putative mitochondrial protein [Cucumis melo var. makuwa]TYK06560.1 putative mitochondrial protein [Cucumis melo var. makuwa]